MATITYQSSDSPVYDSAMKSSLGERFGHELTMLPLAPFIVSIAEKDIVYVETKTGTDAYSVEPTSKMTKRYPFIVPVDRDSPIGLALVGAMTGDMLYYTGNDGVEKKIYVIGVAKTSQVMNRTLTDSTISFS